MKAPPGSVVKIWVDPSPGDDHFPMRDGDVISTPSGRRYVVLSCRVQARGRYVGRNHLRCLVVDETYEASTEARRFWLRWHPR